MNKVLELFPDHLQAMMLFHGWESLERFCSETRAAIYQLPWLSPSADTGEKPICCDYQMSRHDATFQDLAGIVGKEAP